MKTKIRRAFGWILCFALAVIILSPVSSKAEERNSYDGGNIGAQGYSWYYANVIGSYLTEAPDGSLMRVDGNAADRKVVIEYYDEEYKFLSQKQVDMELPIFGGFYSDGSNYYVVTGQLNKEEDNNRKVYCITKYDTDWNRLGSCSLSGANTYIPFDAGTVRMTKSGKWLLIHTCHEMYQSDDGNHHQANVTIEVDTDSMQITDSYTDVMNSRLGYVSHSFNQFILIDGNHMVTLDHGDAYPRSIALLKYRTDFTSGLFVPDYFSSPCAYVSLIDIPGAVGENYTGYTVGGFEMSSGNYIAAGTSDGSNNPYGGTNVWVASEPRDLSGSPVVTYITDYTADDQAASTPQLVQTGTDSFILLWTAGDQIRYCALDGQGNQTGSIYSAKGELSDCKPLLNNGKIIWYVWEDDELTFYDINVNDLSELNVKNLSEPIFTDTELSGYVNADVTLRLSNLRSSDWIDFTDSDNCDFASSYKKDPDQENSYIYKLRFPSTGKHILSVYKNDRLKGQITVTIMSSPSFSKKTYTVKKGKSLKLKVKYGTGDRVVRYVSGNKKIIKTYSNGKIKGLKKGTTTVTAKLSSGSTATCRVRVK